MKQTSFSGKVRHLVGTHCLIMGPNPLDLKMKCQDSARHLAGSKPRLSSAPLLRGTLVPSNQRVLSYLPFLWWHSPRSEPARTKALQAAGSPLLASIQSVT